MSSHHNDEYTLNIDALGYREQADNIRNLIINCDTPFVIGISGRWGSGKTSLMKYLMASLGGKVDEDRFAFHDGSLKDEAEETDFNKVETYYNKQDTTELKKITKYIHSIWFNPWEHENHDEPIIELLKEIRKQFSSISKILAEGEKLGAVALRKGLDMFDGIRYLQSLQIYLLHNYLKALVAHLWHLVKNMNMKTLNTTQETIASN
ncbi:MAG: hypothetical protein HQK92_14875 [Nitrospirae bacterium]|nr:hypothetical protein [Nitrospirota bacterium]